MHWNAVEEAVWILTLSMADIDWTDERLREARLSIPEHIGCYTYIVLCSDGSLYTGWTNDLKKRLAAHNQGVGSKYTRTRRPVRLIYYEESATKQEAMSREWHLKRLSRKEKLDRVQSFLQEQKAYR